MLDNRQRLTVRTEDFISNHDVKNTQYSGIDTESGESVPMDLFKGNVSIEGVSGSGKSVGLNFFLVQALQSEDVEAVVFDMNAGNIEGGRIIHREQVFNICEKGSESLKKLLEFLNREISSRKNANEKLSRLVIYLDELDKVLYETDDESYSELIKALMEGPEVGVIFLCGMQRRFEPSSFIHFEIFQHVLSHDAEHPTHRYAFYDAESKKTVTFPFTTWTNGDDYQNTIDKKTVY